MKRRIAQRMALMTASLLAPLAAQDTLSLQQAVDLALTSNPVIEAAAAGEQQSEAGIRIARAGRLPSVAVSESFTRSNNPVFVFGSLLNQRRFGPSNFEIDRLNNPDALNLFQSVVRVEQVLFDANRAKNAIQAARLRRAMSAEQRRADEAGAILAVVRTYFGVALADESLRVAEQTKKTIEADLARAQAMFDAGMTTKSDVLSVKVHLAAVEEERIRATSQAEIARAALNDALGLELDRAHSLVTTLEPSTFDPEGLDRYIEAASEHPDLRSAAMGTEVAAAETKIAKTALWPTVTAQAMAEADRGQFASQAGGNWLAGVSLQWQVWKGAENRARVAAARYGEDRAEALFRRARSGIQLRVRQAHSEWKAARARVGVVEAAVSEAEESHRIIQNRYDNGLVDVTELIRGQTALMAAAFRRLAALYDVRVARAGLDEAAGILTANSEALQ